MLAICLLILAAACGREAWGYVEARRFHDLVGAIASRGEPTNEYHARDGTLGNADTRGHNAAFALENADALRLVRDARTLPFHGSIFRDASVIRRTSRCHTYSPRPPWQEWRRRTAPRGPSDWTRWTRP